jgi:hypothetical protein
MLRIRPLGWASKDDFRVWDGGLAVAYIKKLSRLRSTVYDYELILRQSGFLLQRPGYGISFVLERVGLEVARAEKPWPFVCYYKISYFGRSFILKSKSLLRRRFALIENGDLVGSIRAPNIFGRTCEADLPASLPLPVRIFIVWLIIVWRGPIPRR